MIRYFGHELDALRLRRVVDATLEDATPMTMCGHLDTMGGYSIIDKLIVLRHQSIKTFLDYVVSVEIFDKRDHME